MARPVKKERRRRAVLVEEDDDLRNLDLEQEDEATKDDLETEEWLSDFQSRFSDQPVHVQVEKFEEGEWAICRKYPLSSFDHEAVRDEFGGGKYRATLFDKKGKYVKGGRNHFKFAAPAIKKDAEINRPADPLQNPAVVLLIKSMETAQANMMGLFQAMITSNAASKASGGIGELVEAIMA